MHIRDQLNDLKTIKFPIPGKVYYNMDLYDPNGNIGYMHVADIGFDMHPSEIDVMRSVVFTYFNGEDPGVLFMVELTPEIHWLRSMSVSDVVVIGENAWRCENVGWSDFDISELPRESMHG